MATWLVNSNAPGGTWSGSIATNVLTLTAFGGATVPVIGNVVTGTGMTAGTTIIGITTSWNGVTGVYTLSNSTSTATTGVIGQSGTSANGWVNALLTTAAAITLSAAGDDFNLASTHAESTAGGLTLTFPGTAANPNRIFSCDTTNAPAQGSDLLIGASITTTGTSNFGMLGVIYCYGLKLSAGTATGASFLGLASSGTPVGGQTYQSCSLIIGATSTTSSIAIGSGTASRPQEIRLINTTVSFGNAAQSIGAQNSRIYWSNTASAVAGTAPTNLFTSTLTSVVRCEGVDLSALGSGKALVGALSSSAMFMFIDCKLGASLTVASTPTVQGGAVTDLIVSDSSATGYRQERYWYQGTLTTSTAVYNAASDGVTPISWQVVTTANNKQYMPFECFEIVQWVAPGSYSASGGTYVNVTSATAGLTNADVWVEAQVLDNGSFPISDLYSSGPVNQLTAGSALTSGSAWTSPLGGTPSNYRLIVPAFTVAIAGYVRFTVKVGRVSATLYVDPDVVVA